ncbi:hypothetical protein KEM48_002812 [Puccinia striiformis f. sp. tritici PST-130]|nr:hypothetical protein KEM48_002812 [Puccinia striiformis f. sp. tritici PST-130]
MLLSISVLELAYVPIIRINPINPIKYPKTSKLANMDMANNPYDPHQHIKRRNSSDEGKVDLCMCMYFQLSCGSISAHWLSKKFKMATRRHQETLCTTGLPLIQAQPFQTAWAQLPSFVFSETMEPSAHLSSRSHRRGARTEKITN